MIKYICKFTFLYIHKFYTEVEKEFLVIDMILTSIKFDLQLEFLKLGFILDLY